MDEFYEIPFAKKYLINRDGKIKNKKTGRLLISYEKNYCQNSIVNNDGNIQSIYVHRVMALVFLPNPDNLPQVNHIDGNKRNNKLENLEWCTAQDNIIHSWRLGLSKPSTPTYKVCLPSNTKRCEINGIEFESIQKAAKHFKVGRSYFSRILSGIWKTKRFTTKYL